MRQGKSPTRLLLVFTLGVLAFLSADYAFEGALRVHLRALFRPIVYIAHSATVHVFQAEFWQTRAALQKDIVRLTSEVEREKGMRAALAAVQGENEILRALLRLADKSGVTAPVISSYSSSPYGTFMIGAGSSAGIQVGDLAIAGDGFVLGSVIDVSDNAAVVSAVFSPGASTDVMTDDVAFSVRGRGGGNARAEVPRELPLTVGTPVLAQRFASRPVGIIGSIESASSSAFSDVYILFPYNINTIRYVFVTPR